MSLLFKKTSYGSSKLTNIHYGYVKVNRNLHRIKSIYDGKGEEQYVVKTGKWHDLNEQYSQEDYRKTTLPAYRAISFGPTNDTSERYQAFFSSGRAGGSLSSTTYVNIFDASGTDLDPVQFTSLRMLPLEKPAIESRGTSLVIVGGSLGPSANKNVFVFDGNGTLIPTSNLPVSGYIGTSDSGISHITDDEGTSYFSCLNGSLLVNVNSSGTLSYTGLPLSRPQEQNIIKFDNKMLFIGGFVNDEAVREVKVINLTTNTEESFTGLSPSSWITGGGMISVKHDNNYLMTSGFIQNGMTNYLDNSDSLISIDSNYTVTRPSLGFAYSVITGSYRSGVWLKDNDKIYFIEKDKYLHVLNYGLTYEMKIPIAYTNPNHKLDFAATSSSHAVPGRTVIYHGGGSIYKIDSGGSIGPETSNVLEYGYFSESIETKYRKALRKLLFSADVRQSGYLPNLTQSDYENIPDNTRFTEFSATAGEKYSIFGRVDSQSKYHYRYYNPSHTRTDMTGGSQTLPPRDVFNGYTFNNLGVFQSLNGIDYYDESMVRHSITYVKTGTASVSNDYVFVANHTDGDAGYETNVYAYDKHFTPLPQVNLRIKNKYGGEAITHAGTNVIIAGGFSDSNYTPHSDVICINRISGVVTQLAGLSEARGEAIGFNIGDYALIAGGHTDRYGTYSKYTIDVYDKNGTKISCNIRLTRPLNGKLNGFIPYSISDGGIAGVGGSTFIDFFGPSLTKISNRLGTEGSISTTKYYPTTMTMYQGFIVTNTEFEYIRPEIINTVF